MNDYNEIEKQLLGNRADTYETEVNSGLENEIAEARELKEKKLSPLKITDISKISPDKKYDKNTIYRVFNRKNKTETFVNGEQAENMVKYTEDYITRFDHRIEMV